MANKLQLTELYTLPIIILNYLPQDSVVFVLFISIASF